MSIPTLQEKLAAIAKKHLNVPTLIARNRDGLDFHDVHCVSLKDALHEAYLLGQREQKAA